MTFALPAEPASLFVELAARVFSALSPTFVLDAKADEAKTNAATVDVIHVFFIIYPLNVSILSRYGGSQDLDDNMRAGAGKTRSDRCGSHLLGQ